MKRDCAGQWASGKKEANIPKVQGAEFQTAPQISEGPAVILVPAFLAAGAIGSGIAGYFIGRATRPRRPEILMES
ncbi:MAG: hypothetical protein IT167_13415 [Bryobacterales bacterium]|nr:hypothetical protein [Bryobacterales bacterium]